MKRSMRANMSWMLVGNVVYAACQWGMLTVLSKLGSTDVVGQFAYALAFTAPVFLFLDFNLRSMQVADISREYQFTTYFALRVATSCFAIATLILMILVVDLPKGTAAIILLISLAKAFDAISDVAYGLFQQRERMHLVARGLMANGVLSLTFLGIGVWVSGELVVGIIGTTLASLSVLLFHVLPSSRLLVDVRELRYGTVWNQWKTTVRVRSLLIQAFPLGVVMLLISLRNSIPRFAIEDYLGTSELGIYAGIAYLLVAGTTLVSAMNQAISPRLAIYYGTSDRSSFISLLSKFMAVGLLMGLVGAIISSLFGDEIMVLLYTSEFAGHTDVLVAVALGGGLLFAASFANAGMIATKRFRAQIPVFLLVLAVTVVGSITLIPAHGLIGAAITSGMAAFAQLLGSVYVVMLALRTSQPRPVGSAA